nr:hypothetical protein [Tanacetum cinerariifolium]
MEEIDLYLNLDDPMPPVIEEDDDDSERDVPILEELLDNYSLLLPTNESYHFDIPLPYCPPAKPPDGNTGTLNIKMMGDVSDQKEPSYNQNCDDNYYPHESPSYPCCDYCGGSHETFQCQPDNQNVDFSCSDQIQTPQYPNVNSPSPEIKYDQSTNTDRPIFLNNNHPENSSEENVVSKTNQEPPQDSDIHQLIEVPEKQKQKMEDTMLELVKICQEKEFLCIHDDNFRVVHKSSISFKNTSQISSIHSIAPIQSTKEPEHLLSMGYEHLSITPETESDAENLLPIPNKCEVTLEDEIECDMLANDNCSPVFTTFSNPLFKDNDDLDSSDDESLPDEDVLAEEFKIYSNSLFDED